MEYNGYKNYARHKNRLLKTVVIIIFSIFPPLKCQQQISDPTIQSRCVSRDCQVSYTENHLTEPASTIVKFEFLLWFFIRFNSWMQWTRWFNFSLHISLWLYSIPWSILLARSENVGFAYILQNILTFQNWDCSCLLGQQFEIKQHTDISAGQAHSFYIKPLFIKDEKLYQNDYLIPYKYLPTNNTLWPR